MPRTDPLVIMKEQFAHLAAQLPSASWSQEKTVDVPQEGQSTGWPGVSQERSCAGVPVSSSHVSLAAGLPSSRPSGNLK